jgi:ferredoxin
MAQVYEIKITDGWEELYHFACRADEPLLHGIRRTLCTEIPRGCSGGGCGICKVVVKSGEATPFKPMSREHITKEELAQNVMLACCINPRSDMEIAFYCSGAGQREQSAEDIYVEARAPETRRRSAQTNGSIAVGV